MQHLKDIVVLKKKHKNLEKLFRENKTSPLLKTPEKDFQVQNVKLFANSFNVYAIKWA